MLDYALGLIETRGLIAAIEAADAACKAAEVVLIGRDVTRGALVTVKVIGEVAAVQSAVEAGAAAALRVGELLSKHVIPRPADGMEIFAPPSGNYASSHEEDENEHQSASEDDDSIQPYPGLLPGASEEQKAEALTSLEALSVSRLRQIARKTPGLDIQGREISFANKDQILGAFRRLLEH